MAENVTRLSDVRPGFSMEDREALRQWAHARVDELLEAPRQTSHLMIVARTGDGMKVVTQTVGAPFGPGGAVGLLEYAKQALFDGTHTP